MQITVEIKDCQECRHEGHSGAFTPGGAKPVCDHKEAVDYATQNKQVNKKNKDDRYHWRHRVIKNTKKIPSWCPLTYGCRY